MSLLQALLLGIPLAGFLVWMTPSAQTLAPAHASPVQRWLPFALFLVPWLVATLVIVVTSDPKASTPWVGYIPIAIVAPALCGFIAIRLLDWFTQRTIPRWLPRLLFGLAILLPILIVADIGTSIFPLVGIFFFCASAITLVWYGTRRVGTWHWALDIVLLPLLAMSLVATERHTPFIVTPLWLSFLIHVTLVFIVPTLAIITAAHLVSTAISNDPPRHWGMRLLSMLLCLLMIASIGYQIQLTTIWDVATDGVWSPFLTSILSLIGIAVAMVITWSVPYTQRWIASTFAVLVLCAIFYAQSSGTYDTNGTWGTTPAIITEQRAAHVDAAIQHYHARTGVYPSTLSQLFPQDALYLPAPLIIPGQTWCYEGGSDYYRLGYVYRQYFSTPASVRMHASSGQPPHPWWQCDREVEKYPAPPGFEQTI